MADLGRIAAGFAAGLGKGLVEQAEAARRESLERIRMEFQGQQAQMDRDFRAGQSDLDRSLRREEGESERDFRLRLAQMQEAGANSRAGSSASAAAAARDQARELAMLGMSHDKEMARLSAELRAAELAEGRAYESGNAEAQREHQVNIERLRAQLAGEAAAEQREFIGGEAEKDRKFRAGESKADYERRTGLQVSQQEFAAGQAALDRDFRAGESEAQRGFSAAQAGLDRDLRATESEADRGLRRDEGEADRSLRRDALALDYGRGDGELIDNEGFMAVRRGGRVERVVGEDGEPIKPVGKAATMPERIKVFTDTLGAFSTAGLAGDEAINNALRMAGIQMKMAEGEMLPVISDPALRAALPSGARYIAPDGKVRVAQ